MAARGVTRKKILQAADKLFGEEGFDAVSTRDVARAAGVNQALIFYHFGKKDDLFGAVLEHYGEGLKAALEVPLQAEGPARARIHGVFDALLDFLEKNARFGRLVQQQLASEGGQLDAVRASLAPLREWTDSVMEELVPAGGSHLDAKQFFVTLTATVFGYFTTAPAIFDGDSLSPEALFERRKHLHWLVDAIVPRLRSERLLTGVPEVTSGQRIDKYVR